MKNIESKKSIYLEEFDIHVNPYLAYAEIQTIANAIHQFHTWAERQQNEDMLILHFATDITDEEIEKIGYNILYNSGLVDAVKSNIVNYYEIYHAVEYLESTQRALAQIINQINSNMKNIETAVKKNAASKK